MKKLLSLVLSIAMLFTFCGCNVHQSQGKPCADGHHSFTKYVYNNDETCLKDGTQTASCDNMYCSATDTKVKPNSKHNPQVVFIEQIDSTCVKHGYLAHYECELCHTFFTDKTATNVVDKDGFVLPLGEHQTEFVAETKSSCVSHGLLSHYYCDVCGGYFTDQSAINKVVLEQLQKPFSDHVFNPYYTIDVNPDKYGIGEISWHCVNYDICGVRKDITAVTREDLKDGWIGA